MKGRYQNSKTTQRGLVRLRLRPDEGLQQVSEGAMTLRSNLAQHLSHPTRLGLGLGARNMQTERIRQPWTSMTVQLAIRPEQHRGAAKALEWIEHRL